MAQVKIYYEPEMELLTVGEPIGMELLSYRPSDNRFDAVSVEMGRLAGIS